MSSPLKRYGTANTQEEMRRYRDGEYVLYRDHKEIVAELRRELRAMKKERDLLEELRQQYSTRAPDCDATRRAQTRYWRWIERRYG